MFRRLATVIFMAFASLASAQQTATAFTNQGKLVSAGVPVENKLDIAFIIYNDDDGRTAVSDALVKTLAPTGGLFTTELDFRLETLIGTHLWLEIVGFDENGKPIGIDYGRLTALIVEATKDKQNQIDEQRLLIERHERMFQQLLERLDLTTPD